MFDIGWSEVLVIAVVAIIVVGPKDLPRMLRAFGKTMGQVRRTANDFKRQFDEALREAERDTGLAETRKSLQSITRSDPLADAKKDFDQTVRRATTGTPAGPVKPASVAPVQPTAAVPSEPEATPGRHAGSDAA